MVTPRARPQIWRPWEGGQEPWGRQPLALPRRGTSVKLLFPSSPTLVLRMGTSTRDKESFGHQRGQVRPPPCHPPTQPPRLAATQEGCSSLTLPPGRPVSDPRLPLGLTPPAHAAPRTPGAARSFLALHFPPPPASASPEELLLAHVPSEPGPSSTLACRGPPPARELGPCGALPPCDGEGCANATRPPRRQARRSSGCPVRASPDEVSTPLGHGTPSPRHVWASSHSRGPTEGNAEGGIRP